MKTFAVIALLIGIGAVPALAQTIDFTYTNSSNVVVASGWLTYDTSTAYLPNNTPTGITSPGYNVTAGSISFAGSTLPLFLNPSVGAQSTSPDGSYYYDDLFFPAGPAGLYLDYDGLLFGEGTGNVVEINVWGNGETSMDSVWTDSTGGIWATQDNGGTFAVPDGGTTLLLLGLAVAGLAGLRRKFSA